MLPIQINSPSHLALQISQQMHDNGWALIGTIHQGFPYYMTVGLELSFQHPNLEIFGLDNERAKNYLTTLVERVQGGVRFQRGDFISDLAEGFDLFFVENPADPTGEPVTGGRLRLVWPDAQHRYPWDADCDDHCGAQVAIPPISGLDLEGLHLLMGLTGTVD